MSRGIRVCMRLVFPNPVSRDPVSVAVVVVLVNNSGGGIFNFLPVADVVSPEVFEAVFSTPTRASFSHLAHAHGVAHRLVTNVDELPGALDDAWALGEHVVVEVVTERENNVAVYRRIQQEVLRDIEREQNGAGAA